MKLERYNQIMFTLLGTGVLIGAVALAALALWASLDRDIRRPGVIVDPAARNADVPPQNLVFCPPIVESNGAYEYMAVGAVVATDASRDPVLFDSLARQSYYGEFLNCNIGGYGGVTRVFNVVVRNRTTNEQRLLLAKPGLVVSLQVPTDKCASGEGPAPCGSLLWGLRPADTNADGAINNLDATVAYVSGLDALTLQAVTPADATELTSQWSARNGRWYFQVRRDANRDGRYSEEDGAEVLETDAAAPVMGQPLVDSRIAASLLAALR